MESKQILNKKKLVQHKFVKQKLGSKKKCPPIICRYLFTFFGLFWTEWMYIMFLNCVFLAFLYQIIRKIIQNATFMKYQIFLLFIKIFQGTRFLGSSENLDSERQCMGNLFDCTFPLYYPITNGGKVNTKLIMQLHDIGSKNIIIE